MIVRMLGIPVPLAAAVLALVLASSGSAAPKSLAGTVGPGYTITLESGGTPVAKLRAGGRYRFVVDDRSSIHNFRLKGPGVNAALTSVPSTGTRSAVVKLRKGVYTFLCDPHASIMRGSFRVG
jgi:hypothetical protein